MTKFDQLFTNLHVLFLSFVKNYGLCLLTLKITSNVLIVDYLYQFRSYYNEMTKMPSWLRY